MNNTDSRAIGTNIQSWGMIFLTVGIAWIFFNALSLLNDNYLLSLILSATHISNDYVTGAVVFVLSVVTTAFGFLVALLVSSAIFKKDISQYVPWALVIRIGIVFAILQIILLALVFTAPGGSISGELFTITKFVGSILVGFASWPFFSWISRTYGSNMSLRSKIIWINLLSILIAFLFMGVTNWLAYESYPPNSTSVFAYMVSVALWYGYYVIVAGVILAILISQIRKSIRWSIAGFIIPMLPTVFFYLAEIFLMAGIKFSAALPVY